MMNEAFSIAGSGSFRDYFGRVMAFDHHANGLVLEAFAGLGTNLPERPLGRMCHIIAAKQVWMARLGAALPMPEELFPLWLLAEAREREEEVSQAVRHRVEALGEDDLLSPFTYRSTEGVQYQTIRGDVFVHLALHGAYHRGQIAAEINPLRAQPLGTDLILFARDATT